LVGVQGGKELIDQNDVNRAPDVPPPGPKKNLDIACGDRKLEGWVGIDIANVPGVDIQHDLFQFPWPVEDSSIDEARVCHFFEHVPAKLRGQFMSEVWRILKPGAGCMFITPRGYERQVMDPTHEWPPIVIGSYFYFDMNWLKANAITHYRDLFDIRCNFDVRPIECSVTEEFQTKPLEHRMFAVSQYMNAAFDLVVLMVKREALE